MTTINHWGKWIDSERPVTGVLSVHDVAWEYIDDEICLTCDEIIQKIESNDSLSEDEKQNELEFLECDSRHTKIFGDWLQDKNGLYYPDPNGEFAAIENESTVQVVYSKTTAHGNPCSPCYPGQVEFSQPGEFKAYTLPDWAMREDD